MTDLHVCDDGPRDAPALLLVHGTGAATGSWDALVPLLTGHRVVRVDLLGHGRSAKPADASYAVPDQARRAGAVLDRLGIGHALVVGHSSGGFVATALAEERPDLVDAVALIGTGPAMTAYTAPSVDIDPERWAEATDDQLRAAMASAFTPGFDIPRVLVDDLRMMTFPSFAATSGAATEYLLRQPIPDRLKVLGVPLLVLFGAEDQRWRPSQASDYHAVPGARVVVMPGLGHSPNVEDPARTAGLLLNFADSVQR